MHSGHHAGMTAWGQIWRYPQIRCSGRDVLSLRRFVALELYRRPRIQFFDLGQKIYASMTIGQGVFAAARGPASVKRIRTGSMRTMWNDEAW